MANIATRRTTIGASNHIKNREPLDFYATHPSAIQNLLILEKFSNNIWEVACGHGTDATLPILKEGLKRTSSKTKKSIQSQVGYVYLSIYPSMAELFGSMANPTKEIAVYAVKVQIKELLADKDQLLNKRLWGENKSLGNTLAESLGVGSGARIKRDFYPYELKKIEKKA